ncbi:MAG: carboxylesterase family protein [Planctomycetota bacterium]
MKSSTIFSRAMLTVGVLCVSYSALGAVTGVTVDDYEARSFTSSQGDTIQYRLFVPRDYDADKNYPLVLFHHGAGGSGNDNRRQFEGPLPREWAGPERQAKNPCFIVAPQIPRRRSSEGEHRFPRVEVMRNHSKTIHEIIDHLEKEFSIDTSREYVTGLSMGGECTWVSIIERPERFAAAVPICAGDKFIGMEPAEMGRKFADFPLWLFHGDADDVISVDISRRLVKALRDAGGNPKYTEYPGVDHGSWELAYREPELIEWMFAQSRPATPPAGIPDASKALFDMDEIRDASTLAVEVIKDWHVVEGNPSTRQKCVTIRVGDAWEGQEYRVPLRMIVPADRKATGFHQTTDYEQPEELKNDAPIRGLDADLIAGGVGLVQTSIGGEPRDFSEGLSRRFIETLNPHYAVQYWAWPATIMRAVTAAYAEKDHFEKGKVATSGGSKHGSSPAVSLISDERITALFSEVGTISDSPIRLCDRKAWDALEAHNKSFFEKVERGEIRLEREREFFTGFIGGTFGSNYNYKALEAGHSWDDIRKLALEMADYIFVTRNMDQLTERGVEMLFHPTTHDFNSYSILQAAQNFPKIPVFYDANGGHGQELHHAAQEHDNLEAFILGHFFDDVEPMLKPPSVNSELTDGKLIVNVCFEDGQKAESGRIWWLYDRGPEASAAFLWQRIGKDDWSDMKFDEEKKVWTAEIRLDKNAKSHIDFFSNHRKTISYKNKELKTYISCPYTRVVLENSHEKTTSLNEVTGVTVDDYEARVFTIKSN